VDVVFFPWDNLVICLVIVIKLSKTVFPSLLFWTLWTNWLNFFWSLKNQVFFGLSPGSSAFVMHLMPCVLDKLPPPWRLQIEVGYHTMNLLCCGKSLSKLFSTQGNCLSLFLTVYLTHVTISSFGFTLSVDSYVVSMFGQPWLLEFDSFYYSWHKNWVQYESQCFFPMNSCSVRNYPGIEKYQQRSKLPQRFVK